MQSTLTSFAENTVHIIYKYGRKIRISKNRIIETQQELYRTTKSPAARAALEQ